MATKKAGRNSTAKRTKESPTIPSKRPVKGSNKAPDPQTIRIPGKVAGGPGCKVIVAGSRVVRTIAVKKEVDGGDVVLTLHFRK